MNNSGRFDSGVADYVIGKAVIAVSFPVDFRGVPDISCKQCYYYKPNTRRCAINGEVTEYPEKYVGSRCPLTIGDDIDGSGMGTACNSDSETGGE